MGVFATVVLGALVLGGGILIWNLLFGKSKPKKPEIKDGWFGRGPSKPDSDRSIVPFTIDVPKDVLEDLKRRIENARLGEDLEDVQFQYGFQV